MRRWLDHYSIEPLYLLAAGYDFTLTSSNSHIGYQFGPDLTADAAGLHWNFSANDHEIFDIQDLARPPSCNCWIVLQTDYSNSPNVIAIQGSNFLLNSTTPSSDLIAASVPEPSRWTMMLLGFIGLSLVFRLWRARSRLRASTRRISRMRSGWSARHRRTCARAAGSLTRGTSFVPIGALFDD
jgi:hypothetical protein